MLGGHPDMAWASSTLSSAHGGAGRTLSPKHPALGSTPQQQPSPQPRLRCPRESEELLRLFCFTSFGGLVVSLSTGL